MAQLPPRIPNIGMNWPANVQQRLSCEDAQPSWIDEFFCFSSARRGSHRRSLSDSVAFFEAPVIDESHNSIGSSGEFEKLDDDQLNSMFSDEICRVPSNPSTSSNHNSNNEEKPTASEQQIKNENEVQSSCKSEQQILVTPPKSINGEPIVDPKRVKRILANRQSAQRSRVRKLQYISELERSITSLQTEVSALSPRVAFLDHQRLVLNVDNSTLKQRIATLAQDKIFKDAHQEALKKEIERLRRVYEQQNLKKSTTATAIAGTVAVRGEELRI